MKLFCPYVSIAIFVSMTHSLTFTLLSGGAHFHWAQWQAAQIALLYNFSDFTLFTQYFLHNQIKGFGLWWPYAMCLWPYVNSWGGLPWKTRCPTTAQGMYACINLRACPCASLRARRVRTYSSAQLSEARAARLAPACTALKVKSKRTRAANSRARGPSR